MKKLLVTTLVLFGALEFSFCQSRNYPLPGDTLSDHLFYDVINYPSKKAKISDFRGKWLILDFWGWLRHMLD